MGIRTSLSIVEPCTTDGSVRLRVVSMAPDSKDHAMCRQFYRDCDEATNPEPYRPYNGFLPPETERSLNFKRSMYAEERRREEEFTAQVDAMCAKIPLATMRKQ